MHHRALVVEVVDGDAGVPEAVPAVGAEKAVGDVAQEDVPGVPRADGLPQDGVHALLAVVPLDDAVAAVPRRRRVGRGREVPAVGGAVEEDAGGAVVQDPLHPPRRVRRPAAEPAQGDARPVLVGVEVPAVHAAPQPHVRPVGELLHRVRRRSGGHLVGEREASPGSLRAAARGRGSVVGEERAEQVRCDGYVWAPRRLGGEIQGGGLGVGWRAQARVACCMYHSH
jgi:hypothetical protein